MKTEQKSNLQFNKKSLIELNYKEQIIVNAGEKDNSRVEWPPNRSTIKCDAVINE